MAYSSEIQAKLGVDTSSVGTDLAGAKNVFNKWGQEVAASGEGHGANFGGKLVGGIEHKIFGARHLSGALAAALGLNIEKIAEKIAAAITDGSAEGWGEALKIADTNAKLIHEKFTDSMSPKQLGEDLEKELKRAIEKANSIHGGKEIAGTDEEGSVLFREAALNAEQLKEQQEAQNEILEIEKKIRELKKDGTKDVKEYEEARKKIGDEELSDAKKYEEINKRIGEVTFEILKGNLSEGEVAKKKLDILKMEHELHLTIKRIQEEGIKEAKKDSDDKEKAQKDQIARAEKLYNLEKAKTSETKKLTEDQNKLTDRSKLTVGELANLQSGKQNGFSLGKSSLDLSFTNSSADDGLSADQVEAKKKAQKIQALEAEAEAKRLSGDVTGSENAFQQVGQMRNELVNSGATKSTEGDKFGELRKQIAEDNKEIRHTLKEIEQTEKGKYVSQ